MAVRSRAKVKGGKTKICIITPGNPATKAVVKGKRSGNLGNPKRGKSPQPTIPATALPAAMANTIEEYMFMPFSLVLPETYP